MSNYQVTISNGVGNQTMQNGTYNVSAVSAPGYVTISLNPSTYTVSESGSAIGNFFLSATGTLTFNVNETGALGGTPVTSGSVIMTDSSGKTQYGSAKTIGSDGNVVFNNVPYGSSETPYTLYFLQLTTDATHNIYEQVITVNMTGKTLTQYIKNTPIVSQTINLADTNYSGLPVANATLRFQSTT